jgi:hypothetical protein
MFEVEGEALGAVGVVLLPILSMGTNTGDIATTLPLFIISARGIQGSVPQCVVLNTKIFAVSNYLNYWFNSFTRFNGVDLACDQNGVYSMDTSSTDDSSTSAFKIKAAIKTGRMDTYKERIQRLRNLWLNYQTDGDANVITTANQTKVRTYLLPYVNVENLDEMIERRVKFERGIKDRYFDFKIENVDGADIEIDKITVMLEPVLSKRR